MQKQVVSEIAIIHGTVDSPKGFEINRDKIKNDIISSFVTNKKFNDSDYEVPFSQPLQWFQDYIRDFYKSEYGPTLVPKLNFAYVLNPGQASINRNTVDLVDLRNSPDYTLLYGVDIDDKLDDLLGTLREEGKLEKDAAAAARKKAEEEKRAKKEKNLERWESLKKTTSTILKPFTSLWDKIWGFLKNILLGNFLS